MVPVGVQSEELALQTVFGFEFIVPVISGLITTVKSVVVAHCPAPGLKVYSVVTVLFMAGSQLPVIPLFDVIGKIVDGIVAS